MAYSSSCEMCNKEPISNAMTSGALLSSMLVRQSMQIEVKRTIHRHTELGALGAPVRGLWLRVHLEKV